MADEFKKLNGIMNRITISSFNKAGRSAVSRVTRLVREGYNIKKSWIDERLKETKVKSADDMVYRIAISNKGLPFILFKPKQIGKVTAGKKRRKNRAAGVKVRIKKSEPILVEGAFIAEMKYGQQAFKRASEKRGSVYGLYSAPQVSQLFASNIAMKQLEKEAVDRFTEIFYQKLDHEANKLSQ